MKYTNAHTARNVKGICPCFCRKKYLKIHGPVVTTPMFTQMCHTPQVIRSMRMNVTYVNSHKLKVRPTNNDHNKLHSYCLHSATNIHERSNKSKKISRQMSWHQKNPYSHLIVTQASINDIHAERGHLSNPKIPVHFKIVHLHKKIWLQQTHNYQHQNSQKQQIFPNHANINWRLNTWVRKEKGLLLKIKTKRLITEEPTTKRRAKKWQDLLSATPGELLLAVFVTVCRASAFMQQQAQTHSECCLMELQLCWRPVGPGTDDNDSAPDTDDDGTGQNWVMAWVCWKLFTAGWRFLL